MPIVPRALLLDFGGVIVDGPSRAGWPAGLAATVRELLAARGQPGPETLVADLTAGLDAYGCWGDAMSRPAAPIELSHEEFWADFVAADWPGAARSVVVEAASELCHRLGALRHEWHLRPGIEDLLADTVARGLGVAVASNTLYGAVHRRFLASARLTDRFAVQLYSDEVGVRKPNPELIRAAAEALGVPVGAAWYVGDTLSRDVRAGLRAGAGCTVLMRSSRTDTEPADPYLIPDLVVEDPVDLHRVLIEVMA